jgi:hypothetical protein
MMEVADVLKEFTLDIPITLNLAGTLLGDFWTLITGDPPSEKSAILSIGGKGASFHNGSGKEFTPDQLDFSGLAPDGELDLEGVDPYTDDPKDPGGGSDKEKTDPAEVNADRELEALDRI